ncbi:hypothetical protein [Aureivirga sp. CE67]|uniref:hypothetical protein n=1 Tax=Aureivirga sp. CE67 TaxID=1788983 RepID=UPI0018C924F8|nr:hypothetical protein [Aureivirga sp. CE67]
MKNLMTYFLLIIFSFSIFLGCENDDSIGDNSSNTENIQESASLEDFMVNFRSYLQNEEEDIEDLLCFDFIYPIKLQFDEQLVITIENFEGLKEIIEFQSTDNTKYGIKFPFQISFPKVGITKDILNEDIFEETIENCNFETEECFEVQFPVQVNIYGSPLIIYSIDQYEDIIEEYDEQDVINIFPVIVRMNTGEIRIIENNQQLESLLEECEDDEDNEAQAYCYTLDFPVEYTINDNEDEIENHGQLLGLIETFISGNNDNIEFDFPYTVISEDDEEFEIEDFALLVHYIKFCGDFHLETAFDFSYHECISSLKYPLQMTISGNTVTFQNQTQHENHFSDYDEETIENVEYVYPITFYLNNQEEYTIENEIEYAELIFAEDCEELIED